MKESHCSINCTHGTRNIMIFNTITNQDRGEYVEHNEEDISEVIATVIFFESSQG